MADKVWYAVTGNVDGHGEIIAVGHTFMDLLEVLKQHIDPKVILKMRKNDQEYVSIQYAELKYSIGNRRG